MVWSFIWINLKPLHPRVHCAKFGWNWPSGSGEDLFISSMYFCYFVIIPPWKRTGLFIWTNENLLHPRMLRAKFGWNWPSVSWEEVESRKRSHTDGRTDRKTAGQTDDGRQTIRKAHLSFKLMWAYNIHVLIFLWLSTFQTSIST